MLKSKWMLDLFGLLIGLIVMNWRIAQAATLPDLVIESVTMTPENLAAGEDVEFEVVVQNIGEAVSSGFWVHLYIAPSDEPPQLTTVHARRARAVGLLPNADPPLVITWTEKVGADGSYPVYAWVDRDDGVAELNEDNNLSEPHILQVGSAVGDGYEPDNTCAEANELPLGVVQTHDLNPSGDTDWVKFEVQSGVRYELSAEAVSTDVALSASVYAECQGSFGSFSQQFTAPETGTYYAEIFNEQSTDGEDTTYNVSIIPLTSCYTHFEPNNSCGAAQPIFSNALPQVHNFCKQADSDWVRLEAKGGYTYRVTARGTGSLADPSINGGFECEEVEESLGSTDSFTFTVPYTIPVYLQIRNDDPDVFGTSTDYELEVIEVQGCDPDVFEQDNSSETAQTINVDAEGQARTICPANDHDWVEFSAAANKVYTIETLNLSSSADTSLYLYDSDGNKITHDYDSGAGNASKINFVPPESGVYRIRVQDERAEVSGTSYELEVRSSPCRLDGLEPDNTLATAQPLIVDGEAAEHTFCAIGVDHDWHVFTTQGGSHVIETFDLDVESDTEIKLYDANGNFLAKNSNAYGTTASQIEISLQAGTYYIELFHADPTRYGAGTSYSVRVYSGQATPPPPTPTPPPISSPTPPPESQIETLIIVNESRMRQKYPTEDVDEMMTQLVTLAAHETVNGEILRIGRNDTINAAYETWDGTTDQDNIDQANATARAIRSVIEQRSAERSNLRYLVLVGDDRMLPFYRILDANTTYYPEKNYLSVGGEHPTAYAVNENYYLTDDLYAAKDASEAPFVLEWAAGRLIESPTEIAAFVAGYLETPMISAESILVTGYDFFEDGAEEICALWEQGTNPNCALIGNDWSLDDYRVAQLFTDPPYRIRSINGHATHFSEETPSRALLATELFNSYPTDGGLVYTPSCHAGLNVPSTNISNSPDNNTVDLPEVYLQLGYNYIANTGYGWGALHGLGLSEELSHIYTQQLLDPSVSNVGTAFVRTKQTYLRETPNFKEFEAKVLQQWTFYGLPMFSVGTNRSHRTAVNPFPSADFSGGFSLSPGPAVFAGQLGVTLTQQSEISGTYFALDGHTQTIVGEVMQPLFFTDITRTNTDTLRGVVFAGGTFTDVVNFDPVVTLATNEYVTSTVEPELTEERWQPELPISSIQIGDRDTFQAVLGQYHAGTQTQRIYDNVQVALFFSDDADITPPTIHHHLALYNSRTGQAALTVGATDASDIFELLITYTDDGAWKFAQLSKNDDGVWTGDFAASAETRYIIQAVDFAGNVSAETNKGHYFEVVDLCSADPTRCAVPTIIGLQSVTVSAGKSFWLLFSCLLLTVIVWKMFTDALQD